MPKKVAKVAQVAAPVVRHFKTNIFARNALKTLMSAPSAPGAPLFQRRSPVNSLCGTCVPQTGSIFE